MANIRSIATPAPIGVDWQGSLFGAGPSPTLDSTFAGLVRHDVGLGAWIDHQPAWLTGGDDLCARIASTLPWMRHTVTMYDRVLDEPRLTQFRVHEYLDRFPELGAAASILGQRYGRDLSRIGAALYRDGNDSVAWHGDRFAPGSVEPMVAIVSLGATRQLRIRPRGGGASARFALHCGDLLVLGGMIHRTHEHCVPKTRRVVGPRISVMWREPSTSDI